MTRPEEALARARAAVAARRAGRGPDRPPDADDELRVAPAELTHDRLLDWAILAADPERVRSTRRGGAPLTWLKRALVRLLRQYLHQLESRQTRFNLQVVEYLRLLEERVAVLEDAAAASGRPGAAPERDEPGPGG